MSRPGIDGMHKDRPYPQLSRLVPLSREEVPLADGIAIVHLASGKL